MKKIIIAILAAGIVCAGAVALTGCNNSNNNSSTAPSSAASSEAASSQAQSETSQIAPNESNESTASVAADAFEAFFAKNPLDEGYEAQMSQAMSTNDMASVNTTYADLWKTEVKNAFTTLSDVVPEADKEKILKEEDDWFRTCDDLAQQAADKVSGDGSMVAINKAAAKKDFYRDEAMVLIERIYDIDGNYTYAYKPY